MLIYLTPRVPYHRLAATPANRWWKTLLGCALVGLAVPALLVGRPDLAPSTVLALDLGAVVLFLPLVFLAARWTRGRRAGTLSSVRGQLRMGWLFTCALVAVPLVALTVNGGFRWVGWQAFVPAMMVIVALVPVQAAAEEYLCRGWVLQSVGAFVRSPWFAVGAQALVFALLHGIHTGWLVFGLVTGWLAVRTGGLEAGIALHAVSNLVAYGLTAGGGTVDHGWRAALAAVAYGLVVRLLATRLRVETEGRGSVSLTPLAELSRRAVPTARGPVLSNRSRLVEVCPSSGR